jgi:hypothetical protein
MSFKSAEATVSAAVAQNGTITFSYPTGTDSGTFVGTHAHKMWVAAHQNMYEAPAGFTVSFGASNITATYKGATTIPAGTRVNAQFDTLGPDDNELNTRLDDTVGVAPLTPFVINLGAPDVLDADGISVSAIITADATIGGALASGGVATFDVPRNVVITGASSVTSVTFTITGTDVYGDTVVEQVVGPTGATTAAGKKAFKTITAISVSGTTTAAVTIGTGDVLGIPVALPQKGLVVGELEDGVNATAGTLVAAVTSAATATTGDVRGTYDPNSACDGSKAFQLLALLPSATDHGVDQYAG